MIVDIWKDKFQITTLFSGFKISAHIICIKEDLWDNGCEEMQVFHSFLYQIAGARRSEEEHFKVMLADARGSQKNSRHMR